MKLPFVSRKKYENERGRIIVYEPLGILDFNTGHDKFIGSQTKCYHDRTVGWVERKEFNTYLDYNDYVKSKNRATQPIS